MIKSVREAAADYALTGSVEDFEALADAVNRAESGQRAEAEGIGYDEANANRLKSQEDKRK